MSQDSYDAIDLSDNELVRLENLPVLKRLRMLLLSNNRISRVEQGLGEQCPQLESLVLTNNRLAGLADIDTLASATTVTLLSFVGNPVVRKPNYRLFTVYRFKSLQLLDYQRVTRKERLEAGKLFASKKGKAILAEVAAARAAPPPPPAIYAPLPGAAGVGASASSAAKPAAAAPAPSDQLTAVEAAQLDDLLMAATTPEQLARIETALADGRIKELLKEEAAKAKEAAAAGGAAASASSSSSLSASSSAAAASDSGAEVEVAEPPAATGSSEAARSSASAGGGGDDMET